LPDGTKERLVQIDTQLPLLFRRHRIVHDALMLVYLTVLIVVVAMVLIGMSIALPSSAVGDAALVVG
jgi:Protein of unknown function (DUF2721)